jgi:hypothetical protein
MVFCIDPNKVERFDTSPLSLESSTILPSLKTSSIHNHSTTHRSFYPDTFSPGAIGGVIFGSLIFIIFISISSFCIRRQRIYYLPYYTNYHPV